MKKTGLTMLALVLGLAPLRAVGESAAPLGVGLAEIMLFTQMRHAKLWLAGSARNWELADYEIDELKEGFEDAVKHVPTYDGIPVGPMIQSMMTGPIGQVEAAIKARDSGKFTASFHMLTAACNSCHAAANRAFIVIKRPGTSVFPNQSFAPRRK
ncbi:MAG TPA: hypothetical protein VMS64_08705 [Candidatus Methylomirabilis sp.]|nr:hypothetical protein [Candidatus Methylomirabilis sp.]